MLLSRCPVPGAFSESRDSTQDGSRIPRRRAMDFVVRTVAIQLPCHAMFVPPSGPTGRANNTEAWSPMLIRHGSPGPRAYSQPHLTAPAGKATQNLTCPWAALLAHTSRRSLSAHSETSPYCDPAEGLIRQGRPPPTANRPAGLQGPAGSWGSLYVPPQGTHIDPALEIKGGRQGGPVHMGAADREYMRSPSGRSIYVRSTHT